MSSAPPSRGPIARLLLGAWRALDFSRRLVFNLLFLLLLAVLLAALLAGGKLKPLQPRTTLVVAPQGRLVEQFSCDALSRAIAQARPGTTGCREVRVRDLLRALEAARGDARIERVVLELDQLQPGGYAALREVAAALAQVRAAGKQVIARGDSFTQGQYLLAVQAGEIYLDPMSPGGVMLEGLADYRQYFHQLLQDKLGVDMHLFKVGRYKSAAEPFVLDAASPEAKEASLYWMNDIWQRLLADVARARRLDPQALAAQIDDLPAQVQAAGGDLAQLALRQKLVDGLKTRDEVDALLAERGVADPDSDTGYRMVDLPTYLQHLDLGLPQVDPRPQVAVVVAEGEIASGERPPGSVGGESTSALLRQAREDEHVKAVVLRVNSPGGEVFPSEQIRREVVALKQAGKPVVVSMGDVAASGGYWIGMNADRIFADPSTITGSIGIYGLFPTLDRGLAKLGVYTDGVATTRYAGAFDLTRPLAPGVAQVVQAVIAKGYAEFTGKVAKARGRSVAQIDAVAQGRVWSGAQARERGLVDALGGLQDAIADAAARAKLGAREKWQVQYVEQAAQPFAQWFGQFLQGRLGQALLGQSGAAALLLPRLQAQAPQALLARLAEQAAPGHPLALAHCLCQPR